MSLHDLLVGKPCGTSLRGRRVLVVEDDYLVAQDLLEELLRSGAEVMGPAATVADALALVRSVQSLDMAVLDIKLGDGLVYPVAEVLRARGISFIFATGFDPLAIPTAYADVAVAQKPMALVGASLVRRV